MGCVSRNRYSTILKRERKLCLQDTFLHVDGKIISDNNVALFYLPATCADSTEEIKDHRLFVLHSTVVVGFLFVCLLVGWLVFNIPHNT
jgi:hypothetical protein